MKTKRGGVIKQKLSIKQIRLQFNLWTMKENMQISQHEALRVATWIKKLYCRIKFMQRNLKNWQEENRLKFHRYKLDSIMWNYILFLPLSILSPDKLHTSWKFELHKSSWVMIFNLSLLGNFLSNSIYLGKLEFSLLKIKIMLFFVFI